MWGRVVVVDSSIDDVVVSTAVPVCWRDDVGLGITDWDVVTRRVSVESRVTVGEGVAVRSSQLAPL